MYDYVWYMNDVCMIMYDVCMIINSDVCLSVCLYLPLLFKELKSYFKSINIFFFLSLSLLIVWQLELLQAIIKKSIFLLIFSWDNNGHIT
jgi:hypothetical protein